MRLIASKIAFAAALAAGSYLPITAIATPISASMDLTANVQAGSATNTNNSNSSWGILLDPLSLDTSASILIVGSNFSITASGQGDASWGAGGNSGSVLFTNYGWDIALAGSGVSSTGANLNTGGPDWTYTFKADTDGTFVMNYDVSGTGNLFGLQGWNIAWSGLGGGLDLVDANDPTANGIFSRPLVAGQTYTVALHNGANVSSGDGIDLVGSMNGTFEWNIQQSVPEPGTLALLGLGLVGLAVSRQREM
jgi:PEP-CTERM motif